MKLLMKVHTVWANFAEALNHKADRIQKILLTVFNLADKHLSLCALQVYALQVSLELRVCCVSVLATA